MALSQRSSPRSGRRSPPPPRKPGPVREFLTHHLGGQSDDLWGLALIVVGLLSGLGIFFNRTGILGRFVRFLAEASFGWGKVAVPVLLIAVGWVLVRGRPREEPLRVVIGSAFVLVSACGILHLAKGGLPWGTQVGRLRRAGGLLGMASAAPLRSLIASWGAYLVLGCVGVLGLLVLTRMRLRQALSWGASGAGPVFGWVGRGVRSLFTLGSEEQDHAKGRHPTATGASGAPKRPRPPRALPAPDDAGTAAAAGVIDTTGAELDRQPAAEGGDQGVSGDADGERAPLEIHVPPEPQWKEGMETAVPQNLPGLSPEESPAVAWRLPPLALLKKGKGVEVDKRMVEAMGRTLEEALASHGVETRLVGSVVGPTVTRYELELAPGVKVGKVTALQKDIAYAMASPDVRILAPIPGKSAIGVEVPNRVRQLVAVGDILATEEAQAETHPLTVAIGRDIAGRPVLANLATMPHVLVAGTTGSGKSSCVNVILTSLLMRTTPDQVRLILVDPKRVEMGQYNHLPHLLTQVVTNPKKAANALQWAVHEMERRYDLLAELGFRDIIGYNAAVERGDLDDPYADDPAQGIGLPAVPKYQKLPYVVVVVDELSDLMMVAARDVEESICRIAQMARAVGIHLIIATQRPSVDVITGLIKANVPSRFAFAVSSQTDSRVILDQPGAEKLIGQGDMLMLTASSNVARRIQNAFVSEEEVRNIVGYWRRQASPMYVNGVEGEESAGGGLLGDDEDGDDMLEQAMTLVVESQLGSTSMLQRKLRVGFARAGRLMDLLERRGVVGPSEGSKARAVLMTPEELEEFRGRRGGA